MNTNAPFTQTLKLLALILALFFLLSGYITLTNRSSTAEATATRTATPEVFKTTAMPPTATASATTQPTATPAPTATPSATATATPAPTETPTSTPPPTDTATATATIALTDTPAATETLPLTETLSLTDTTALTETTTLSGTLAQTQTVSGPPTQTPTPTITPTPVPRTVRAVDLPDYTQAVAHFWFSRPYTEAFATWGSSYYPYGTNNNGQYLWHSGSDIQNLQNTPIVAAGDGVVVFAGKDNTQLLGPETNFYGQAVVIQHTEGWAANPASPEKIPVYTLYGHVSKWLVKQGQSVVTGQPIALTGQEGVAMGPHLHLEIRTRQNSYANTQNPDLWVRPDAGYGVIAGRVIDANGYYVPQQLITLHVAATPNKFWRQTRTYPDKRYTPDPQLGETFVFGDVPAGNYVVKTSFDGKNYTFPVTVKNQAVSFVEILGSVPPVTTAATPDTSPAPATETPPPAEALPTPESSPTPANP